MEGPERVGKVPGLSGHRRKVVVRGEQAKMAGRQHCVIKVSHCPSHLCGFSIVGLG